MLIMLWRLICGIIYIDQYNVNEVMEVKGHNPLKSGSCIFKAKRYDTRHKSALGGSKSGFVLIFFADMDLVITRKTIHEGKYFVASTRINDLVNEWSGKVVFGKFQIQVTKFSTDVNGTLFFVDRNRVRNPSVICNGIYETFFTHFLNLRFKGGSLNG